jgi:hypothetical protein
MCIKRRGSRALFSSNGFDIANTFFPPHLRSNEVFWHDSCRGRFIKNTHAHHLGGPGFSFAFVSLLFSDKVSRGSSEMPWRAAALDTLMLPMPISQKARHWYSAGCRYYIFIGATLAQLSCLPVCDGDYVHAFVSHCPLQYNNY